MNNKLSFRKTPLALAVAGLVFSMSAAQADSASNWGRWAGGFGGGGSDDCDPQDPSAACNQDETLVQRDVTGTGGETTLPDEVPDGQWTIYASKFEDEGGEEGAEPTGLTGKGTLLVPPITALDGGEGNLEVTLAGNYNGNLTAGDGESLALYPSDPDVVPFLAISNNEDGEGFILSAGLEREEDDIFFDEDALDFVPFFDDDDGQYADGIVGFDFISFIGLFAFAEGGEGGAFFAGQPTLFTDMASLQAGNISANYGGFAPDTGHDVFFEVNFGPATFDSSFTEGVGISNFGASGVISGADFSSTSITGGADTGFVEGTFFSGDGTAGPDALGGRFEVNDGEVFAGSAFGAVLDQEPGGSTIEEVVGDIEPFFDFD